MPQNPRNFSALFGKHLRIVTISVTAAAALATVGSTASADPRDQSGAVKQLFTIPVPKAPTNTTGGMYGFDISFVDSTTQTYYLGDRSNAAVDVVDAKTGVFLKQITASPPFAGVKLNTTGTAVNNNISGPNGVAASGNCLFAGDGPSRVVSFSLPGGTQVSDFSTGGMARADEMAFDPKDRVLVVANNADSPPFATLINVDMNCKLTLRAKTLFTFATNGAEQAVWNPMDDKFYQSIPSTSGTTASPGTTGAIIRINPLTGAVEETFPIPSCMPAGLALGPDQTFLAGCSVVYDTTLFNPWSGADTLSADPLQVIMDANGNLTFVQGVGSSDEVWFNSGDNRYYTGSWRACGLPGGCPAPNGGAVLGVINAGSNLLIEKIPQSQGTHSVAADPRLNRIYVPQVAPFAVVGAGGDTTSVGAGICGSNNGCVAVYVHSSY